MSKTIIVLRGQPNSGKTTTIMLAHDQLSTEGESVFSNTRWDAAELKEVLEIDGVYVGFASAGDKPDRLERILEFLVAKGCAVIVCAARLNRDAAPLRRTIDVVEQFAEEREFNVLWIDKLRQQEERESANRKIADKIVFEVCKAIRRARLVGV